MGLSAHGHRSQHPGTAPASCLHSHRANNGTGPSSTNGTRYNDKKIKRLVEPIEIRALEEMEDLSMGKYLFFVSAQDACRAKRTLAKILIVVFGSVSTRGPSSDRYCCLKVCATSCCARYC